MPDLVPRGPEAPSVQAPSVMPTGLPGARMDTQMPLAAAGGGQQVAEAYGAASGLAKESGDIFQDQYQKHNQVGLDEALIKLGLQRNQIQADAYKNRGKDALGIADKGTADFMKAARDIQASLSNRDQQVAFAQHIPTNVSHLDHALRMHETGQLEQYADKTEASGIKQQQDSAILNWQSWNLPDQDNAVDHAAQGVLHHVGMLYQGKGEDPAAVEFEKRKAVSATYAGVVKAMLDNGQDLTASQAFQKYSEAGYFTGLDKAVLASAVEGGTVRGTAQKVVDQAFAQQVFDYSKDAKPPREPESKAEVMERVRTATEGMDPKVRDEAEARASRRWAVQVEDQREANDKNFQNAAVAIRKALSAQNAPNQVGSVPQVLSPTDVISPTDWEKLPEGDRVHLDSLVKQALRAPKIADDPQKVTHFYGIVKEDLAKMSEADVMRYAPYVTEGTYNKMVERWSASRQKEEDAKFAFGEADEKRIWQAVQDGGIGGITGHDKRETIDQHKDKSDAYQNFRKEAMEALEARFQDKKKNVDPKERDQVINDLMVDKVVHQERRSSLTRYGGYAAGGAPLGPGWAVVGGGLYTAGKALDWYRAPSIPSDERKAIVGMMKDLTGSEPSDEKIIRYKRAKMMRASDMELHKIAMESE